MKNTLITEKGQIPIPVQIRKKYGLKPGTKVTVSDDGHSIRVTPLTAASIRKLAGILKGGDLTKALLESRKKDTLKNK
jgi:AbrB family looped-hinge helix DNA binding protein